MADGVGYNSVCPTCGEKASSWARCISAETYCKNGHTWHKCRVHNVIVVGRYNPTNGYNSCTCKKE